MVSSRLWLPRPHILASPSSRFGASRKGDCRYVLLRRGDFFRHGMYPPHTDTHAELWPVEDTSVCTNTVISCDVRGCIWGCKFMRHESIFHGSGVARGDDLHRLRSDDHLLQHCHDTAGAWQYGLDGCAVDIGQLAWTVSLPTAAADVHCR